MSIRTGGLSLHAWFLGWCFDQGDACFLAWSAMEGFAAAATDDPYEGWEDGKQFEKWVLHMATPKSMLREVLDRGDEDELLVRRLWSEGASTALISKRNVEIECRSIEEGLKP